MVLVIKHLGQVDAFAVKKAEASAKARIARLFGGHALFIEGVASFELIKNADLNFARIAILLDGSDNLDGVLALGALAVNALDDLAECALAELAHDSVCDSGTGEQVNQSGGPVRRR